MSDEKIIFSMHRVSKVLNSGKQIIKNISLSFFYGAKIGIIGANGSGKSTVLKIIAGLDKAYQGEVVINDQYSVGYLSQEPELDNSKTVRQVVEEGVSEVVQALSEFEAVNNAFADPKVMENPDEMDRLIRKQAEIQEKIDEYNGWDLDNKLSRAMDALNCPPENDLISKLSGGERRRVALVRLLLKEPDILLLDEPTNHLDAESVYWLEQHLKQYKGTVIAVTHDRYFLDNVSGWILELDRGEGIPWKGNYSSWLEQKSIRLKTEEKQESRRQKILKRELEWSRMSPKAKQVKSKARLSNYEKLQSEKSKEKIENLELYIPNGQRLGNKVIEFENVSKSFGNRVLIENLTFSLPPAGIVGIIGPNGAGKTTLFRMIMGEEQMDSGTIGIGESVQMAYVDQSHKDVDQNKTVWEVVCDGLDTIEIGGNKFNSRAYLAQFNFTGSDQNKKVNVLSGGERNRLHLAMTLKLEANVLLLDEPTNDIDVNTLRALEEGIENFSGCAVVISHDRWFLDRICTH
ncbi:MAG TPA: energy-dependent translational throttle protein EttA, partial [Flavobacteriales bacterium]|nr:energy-dependent translational throttle protein EttA [Flavobacteriales bacterium]